MACESVPADPLREHRLYQASFLLRDYGWDVEDLPFADDFHINVQPAIANWEPSCVEAKEFGATVFA